MSEDITFSKIERFPTYKEEFQNNKLLFDNCIKLFNSLIDKYLNDIFHAKSDILTSENLDHYLGLYQDFYINNTFNANECFIKFRITDVLVSVTDDLLRYATYHRISTMKSNASLYSISENVRASYFLKWILRIKPSSLDIYAYFSDYSSMNEDDKKHLKANHFFEYPNEYLALIAVYIIFNADDFSFDRFDLDKIFNGDEISLLFYSLRYRMNHQDVFSMWLKRLKPDFQTL